MTGLPVAQNWAPQGDSVSFRPMSNLEQHIQGTFGIHPDKLSTVAGLFEEEQLQRGEYYLRAGAYCQKMSFIQEGFVRVFAVVDGKEVTQWVSASNYFITELASLQFGIPSRWNIEALSDCRLQTIHLDNYQRIGEIVPEWVELEKLFIAKCFVTLENRVFSFLSMTAEERYQALWQQSRELFQQVPQHYLASMLGMTPETFSRIRKKLSS